MNLDRLAVHARRGRELLAFTGREFEAHDAFQNWSASVADWLDEHAPASGLSAEWSALETSNIMAGSGYDPSLQGWIGYRKAVQNRLMWLSRLARLQNMAESHLSRREPPSPSGRVFVVHGRDEALREQVARLLEQIGLQPVILHEQPNRGRSILEKFVDYSDVSFAIVILTGDDEGRMRGIDTPLLHRARQNVLFELGFFVGKLGREYVAALYEEGVELPSDYQGILFTPVDTVGAWRYVIARELRDARLAVDLNRIE